MTSRRHSIQRGSKFKRYVPDRKKGLFTCVFRIAPTNSTLSLFLSWTLWFRVWGGNWKNWMRAEKLLMRVLFNKSTTHKIWKVFSCRLMLRSILDSWVSWWIWSVRMTIRHLNLFSLCYKRKTMVLKKSRRCWSLLDSKSIISCFIF